MKKNNFELNIDQLKDTAQSFREKFERGLREENTEIQCLPTYIKPYMSIRDGKALVLDLGGTNYRAAIVNFNAGHPSIHPEDGWKKKLDIMKEPGFTREDLFQEQADLISEIEHEQTLPIGYCFSYPAESLLNGDARLLRWTKGVDIPEMIGQSVGQPLMDYLNHRGIARFNSIKVINDTVASLFAGLANRGYDAYIGLIVGTGTNMAAFVPNNHIPKINPGYKHTGLIPVNLESGNFTPPYLTEADDDVDRRSDSPGRQRFEKAVSGMYVGEIFKYFFPEVSKKEEFNARDLNYIVNNPDMYKEDYVFVATQIFKRSAQLVAASLAGLILSLVEFDINIKKICLTAEGSMFWSKFDDGDDYNEIVIKQLYKLLSEYGYGDIRIDVEEKKNINLIGTAVAALS